MKTPSISILLLFLTGCNYFEAQSTLRSAHRIEYPTTEEHIVEIAGCNQFWHRQLIADRFFVNPGASFTMWYTINDCYDLVIKTDSTTNYRVMTPNDVWIEKSLDNR